MRANLSSAAKALALVAVIALSALFAMIEPAIGGNKLKPGSFFLFDESTDRIVGLRNSDNSETYFPLYTTLASATATAAFTPAAPGAIGGTTPAAGTFTTLTASSSLVSSGTVTFSPTNRSVTISPTGTGTVTINPTTAGTMNNIAIGGTTPLAGVFTTVAATSTLRSGTTTVGSLGTCNGAAAGTRHFVTDANSTTFLATAAAGGANAVPVVCDGTNWVIG